MTGRGADHVVAMLLDGTNANVLYDLAARGKAPNLARLMASGCTYRYGAIASLPTVTLANHTTILTGRHPGHHGILHNAWVDRVTGDQVVTNSPTTWISAMEWLAPGTETVHQALHRGRPGAVSVSVNEPCDVGADYSVFELMRSGEPIDRPPPVDELPDATQRFVRPSKDYRWSSLIDHTAVEQFVGIWSGTYRGRRWKLPEFTWVNFTLTDAAFHEGGPYSEIAATSVADTDARIGRILEAVERSGVWDRTAFFVVADHGMELADSAVTGDWDVALRRRRRGRPRRGLRLLVPHRSLNGQSGQRTTDPSLDRQLGSGKNVVLVPLMPTVRSWIRTCCVSGLWSQPPSTATWTSSSSIAALGRLRLRVGPVAVARVRATNRPGWHLRL